MKNETTISNAQTVAAATAWLRQNGYVYDFTLKTDRIQRGACYQLKPHRFQVDHVFQTNCMDTIWQEVMLYGISFCNGGIKGVMLTTPLFAVFVSDEMREKLTIAQAD